MALNNAKIEMALGEFQQLQEDKAVAEKDAAALRAQLVDAKLADPSGRIPPLVKFARECLKVTRFAIGNLAPETVRGWPYEALHAIANGLMELPDCSIDDRDLAIEIHAFAKECEKLEHDRRRASMLADA